MSLLTNLEFFLLCCGHASGCLSAHKTDNKTSCDALLQIGSKLIEINTLIWSRNGDIFHNRFGFQRANLENRWTDANWMCKSAPKLAQNWLDRTSLRLGLCKPNRRSDRIKVSPICSIELLMWPIGDFV